MLAKNLSLGDRDQDARFVLDPGSLTDGELVQAVNRAIGRGDLMGLRQVLDEVERRCESEVSDA